MHRISKAVAVLAAALLFAGVFPATSLAVTPLYLESISFADADNGMLTGGFGNITGFVSVTSDGGENWRSIRVDPDTWYRASALGEEAGSGVVARLYGGTALVTTDSGSTWSGATVRSPGGGFQASGADMEGGSNGWIAGDDGGLGVIMTTSDGGATWAETYEGPKYPPPDDPLQPLPTAFMRAVDGADPQTAWAVGLERNAGVSTIKRAIIQKTTDGGSTWTTQSVSDNNWTLRVTPDIKAVSAVDSRTAFAVGGGRDRLFKTTDGEAWTWGELSGSNSQILHDISMVSTSTGWACGTVGRVYRTTDGWTSRTGGQVPGVAVTLRSVHSIDASRAWVVGDNETIVYTIDGGATWLGTKGNKAPTAAFTAPASSAVVTGTTLSVEGTATDGVGVGVVSTDVRIKRSDGKYWGGSGWQSTEAWLPGSTSDHWTTWSYDWSLDAGQNRAYTYSFAWRAADAVSNEATSADVVTGLRVDNAGPTLVNAYQETSTSVRAQFSEPVTSVVPGSFSLDGGLSVVTASAIATVPTDVRIQTTAHVAGQTYTLTSASGAVRDPYGNASSAGADSFTAASGPAPFLTVTQGSGIGRPTSPFFAAPGETVVLDQFVLGSHIGTTTVQTVTVEATGSATGSFASDVATVALVNDNDADGTMSVGDTLAAAVPVSGASLAIPVGPLTISADASRTLLVAYQLSASAADGHAVGSKVTSVGVSAPAGVDPFPEVVSAGGGHTVVIDAVAPLVSIAAPSSGALLGGDSATVSGTATETGSGLDSMALRIMRDDSQYWTGSAWTGSETWVPVAEGAAWDYDWALDEGQNEENDYAITVRATDAVGHETTAAVSGVTVDNMRPVAGSASAVDATHVDVTFSERLTTSTVSIGDFVISGAAVSAVSLQPDGKTVRLTASGLEAAKRYRVRVGIDTITDLAGNGCDAFTGYFVAPGVGREAGGSRYETAIEISEATFASGECTNAVLATGQGFADALAASGLAGALGGPLLLTPKAELHAALPAEFSRLGVTKVWIVGGTAAVSADVETSLTGLNYEVERLAGGTRYGTAAVIATQVAGLLGDDFAHRAFVVRGDGFADALAVSPAAAANGFPVLLTPTTALPAETIGAITSLGITETVIAGGTGAVSSAVETELAGLAANPVRKAGTSRYGTAAEVSAYAVQRGWLDDAFAGVATGRSFADALGGGVSAGAKGGVLLLTDPAALSAETQAFIVAHPDLAAIAVFGGAGAVSDTVLAQISALM